MKTPFAPGRFGAFLFAAAFLFAVVQLGVITIAFDKLGLSPEQAMALLLASLAGSLFNIPVIRIDNDVLPAQQVIPPPYGMLKPYLPPFEGKTTIAVNVGGCIIPVFFSVYLLTQYSLPVMPLIVAIAFVSLVSRFASTPIAGIGIGMPILVAPLAAATVALLMGGSASAPLAYIAGTLGVLIGADVMRIKDILRLAVPIASIGGAGTFDGIFVTGLVAVLLA